MKEGIHTVVVAIEEIDVLLQNGLVGMFGGPVAGCGAVGCLA
jgi:hypothetical protein